MFSPILPAYSAQLAVGLNPKSANGQNNLAHCLSRVKRVGEALPASRRACELLPDEPSCNAALALNGYNGLLQNPAETAMAESENLVLEILRRMQGDMADLKQGQRSIRDELIGVRQQLHALQGDILRQEQDIASVLVRLDRIEARLDLVEH